mmetsp:Transcript_91271/g.282328  ORF Transcript_91271/g.282328 Transcript_91271/m.282328 type:complete len:275 (-) Transcript_91271:4-828(-)
MQQAAPELHAQRGEEEDHDAQEGEDVLRGGDEAGDGLHHLLHRVQALQLLEHPEEAEEPQNVHVALDVGTRRGGGHLVQQGGGQEQPGHREVELVRARAPVEAPGVHAQVQAHLRDVDQGEGELHVLHERRLREAPEVPDGLPDDGGEVQQQHIVHEGAEVPGADALAEPGEGLGTPQPRQQVLHGGVPSGGPEVVLDDAAYVAELALVHQAAAVAVDRCKHDVRGGLGDRPNPRRPAELLGKLAKRLLGDLPALPSRVAERLEGVLDALHPGE